MTIEEVAITPQIAEALTVIERLTSMERLQVARYLLDSVLTEETNEKVSWQNLGLAAFKNEDAIRPVTQLRPYGLCAGEFEVPDDFDDPLPSEILKTFEGE